MNTIALSAALLMLAAPQFLVAQAPKAPPAPYANDFQSAAAGELPDGMMEIDGAFVVVEADDGVKFLEMAAEPLAENAVIFGSSIKGGGTVEARVRSFRKRRSYPRFGVGLHGISGFRLRVVPSSKRIQLVKNEEVVESLAFDWKPDSWLHLQLAILPAGDKWKVEGRAWPDGEEAPAEPTIALEHEGPPGQGKASIWGTAYSGKVVQFDDIKVTPAATEK